MSILTLEDIQTRFKLADRRAARALMGKLPHFKTGKSLYTTEGHLAQYVAAQTVGDLAKTQRRYDPLADAAERIALGAIERMTNEGKLTITVNPAALAS